MAGGRAQPKRTRRRPSRLLALLSLAGMCAVLAGGVVAAILLTRKAEKDSATREGTPPPADPRAERIAGLLREAAQGVSTLAKLARESGDVGASRTKAVDDVLRQTGEVLSLEPDEPVALALRGQARWHAGDLAAAEVDLRASLAKAPMEGSVAWRLAELQLERRLLAIRLGDEPGDPAPLEAEMVRLADSGGQDAPRDFCRAAAHFLAGRPQAVGLLDEALERAERADLARLRAAVGEAAGDPLTAVTWFDRALKHRPQDPVTRLGRALARTRLRRWAEADGDLAEVMRTVGDPRLRALRATIRQGRRDFRGAIEDWTAVDRPVDRGFCRLELREYSAAEADARESLKRDPSDPRATALLARILLWQAKVEDGAMVLDEALRTSPKALPLLVQRVELRVLRENLDGALEDGETAVAAAPADPLAWCARGEARLARGEHGKALSDFVKAKSLDPVEPRAHIGLARAMEAKGETSGALFAVDEALRLDPDNPELLVTRASLRADEEDYRAALADVDRALKIDPNLASAYSERGMVRLRMGDLEQALKDIERAIELRPVDRSSLEKILRKPPKPPDENP